MLLFIMLKGFIGLPVNMNVFIYKKKIGKARLWA